MKYQAAVLSILFLFFFFGKVSAVQIELDIHGREMENVRKYGIQGGFVSIRPELYNRASGTLRRLGILSMTQTCYDHSIGKAYKISTEEYDKKGFITRKIDFTPDGNFLEFFEYEYDGAGRMTKLAQRASTGTILKGTSQKYYENGDLMEIIDFGLDEAVKLRVEFVKKENILEIISHDPVNKTAGKSVLRFSNGVLTGKYYDSEEEGAISEYYDYNGRGDLGEINRKNSKGEILLKWSYKYDDDGYITETSFNNLPAKWAMRSNFKYDAKHCLIKYESLMAPPLDKTAFRQEAEYDADGNIVKLFSYSRGGLDQLCEYDAVGNVVKIVNYTNGKAGTSEKFKYDVDGLPVEKCIYSRNGDPEKTCGYVYRRTRSGKADLERGQLLTEASVKNECVQNMRRIEAAIDLYDVDNHKKPSDLEALVKMNYFSDFPKCPKKGKYSFEFENGIPVVKCAIHGNYR